MNGASPNQAKKQRKNANQLRWNARICGERKSSRWIRVALPAGRRGSLIVFSIDMGCVLWVVGWFGFRRSRLSRPRAAFDVGPASRSVTRPRRLAWRTTRSAAASAGRRRPGSRRRRRPPPAGRRRPTRTPPPPRARPPPDRSRWPQRAISPASQAWVRDAGERQPRVERPSPPAGRADGLGTGRERPRPRRVRLRINRLGWQPQVRRPAEHLGHGRQVPIVVAKPHGPQHRPAQPRQHGRVRLGPPPGHGQHLVRVGRHHVARHGHQSPVPTPGGQTCCTARRSSTRPSDRSPAVGAPAGGRPHDQRHVPVRVHAAAGQPRPQQVVGERCTRTRGRTSAAVPCPAGTTRPRRPPSTPRPPSTARRS